MPCGENLTDVNGLHILDAPGGAVCSQVNLALDLFLGLAAGRASAGGKGVSSRSWIVSGLDLASSIDCRSTTSPEGSHSKPRSRNLCSGPA